MLKEVKDIIGLSEISIVYKEKLSSKEVEKFISILNDFGIRKLLWIDKYNHNNNNPLRHQLRSKYSWSDRTGISRDYGIYGLDKIINFAKNRQEIWCKISKLIWMSILEIEPIEYYIKACYCANQKIHIIIHQQHIFKYYHKIPGYSHVIIV